MSRHTGSSLVAAGLLAMAAACDRGGPARATDTARQAIATVSPAPAAPAPALPARFGSIGRAATNAEVAAWNIDANAAGVGLPAGRGTYARGAELFAAKCAACHGAHGEGIAPFPKLIGRDPREGFPFGQDPRYAKTIGNYWPYATTVYDYINRAMPFTAPGSLRPDEVYSLVAYLLAENEIVQRGAVLDARALRAIRMPAHDRFVADTRMGGAGFR